MKLSDLSTSLLSVLAIKLLKIISHFLFSVIYNFQETFESHTFSVILYEISLFFSLKNFYLAQDFCLSHMVNAKVPLVESDSLSCFPENVLSEHFWE